MISEVKGRKQKGEREKDGLYRREEKGKGEFVIVLDGSIDR